ncbi:hypothetical protein BOTBODRAFT_179743 [Botryobasidium botryosum FD-172 SS1]|uniref:Uncharacterized protein n=1 Tax=Botryobasidium botryosum (strain FD-172 SS1) TaxID=930990 RepID=A0A067LZ40_BOTB1|nr:hypothetical protein BOTBODRAFT_179743 [Botryobasidium botryosum FD-172 SS1]
MLRCPTSRAFGTVSSGYARTSAKQRQKPPPPPPPTAAEIERMRARRERKAERDERMDLTMVLTPVKTYMGGFTRPRDLRASNWFYGGPYVQRQKVYVKPPEAAYRPHSVYILETLYPVNRGIGRAVALEFETGTFPTNNLSRLVNQYNYAHLSNPYTSVMDIAAWPWLKRLRKREPPLLSGNCLAIRSGKNDQNSDNCKFPEKSSDIISKPLPKSPSDKTASSTQHTNPAPSLGRPSSRYCTDDIRSHYLPTLFTTPFFRPLLCLTFPTRPLAHTVSRLTKSLSCGLSYPNAIDPHERKFGVSYASRIRNLRLQRTYDVVETLISRLKGYRGGLPGLRFSPHERGWGINGEGLEEPIDPRKWRMEARIGSWYPRAQELARQWGELDNMSVKLVDEFGCVLGEDSSLLGGQDAGSVASDTWERFSDEEEEEEESWEVDRMWGEDD